MQREGGSAFGGGGGGFGGPGGGGIAIGRLPRGFNVNQPHGILYFSDDTSALDARSYSLTGIELPKPDYNQSRFGVNVGGPLNIRRYSTAAASGSFSPDGMARVELTV